LAEWKQWCKGKEDERRTLQVTAGLVSQVPARSQNRLNPSLSDATNVPAPPGLSTEARARLDVLKEIGTRCERNIKHIELTVSMLRRAQQTGMWAGDRLDFIVVKERRYISPVLGHLPRGEEVEILEINGDWWRVRTQRGIEGWVDRAHIAPLAPVQLWKATKPTVEGGEDEPHGIQMSGRG
jgi:hypothetical protein